MSFRDAERADERRYSAQRESVRSIGWLGVNSLTLLRKIENRGHPLFFGLFRKVGEGNRLQATATLTAARRGPRSEDGEFSTY